MSTYHERVARQMKSTYAAGSLNSYDDILAALQRRFPTESELREHVATLERAARAIGAVDFHFLNDNGDPP